MQFLLQRRTTAAVAFGLLAGACGAPTRLDLPAAGADPVLANATQTLMSREAGWPTVRWWETFEDPQLTRLVDQALIANPDLKTASARARSLASVAQAASAATRPAVNASASITRERLSESGLAPPPYGGSWLTASDVSVALSWKLDVFGAERARIAARRADATAAAFDASFARSATSAAVARLYFELGAAEADRAVIAQTLSQREVMLKITRGRHDAGMDSTADLRQAEARVPTLELERAGGDERIAVARAALAALLGTGPDETATLTPPSGPVAGEWGIPADLRMSLLARRADVAAARARVEAAAFDVDAVRRDYLPNLRISALAGLNSLVPAVLFNGSSRQFSAGPAIGLPIYGGGRRRAVANAKTAEFDVARAAYERAVVTAVQDVATALAHLQASGESRRAAAAALALQRDAYRIAELRYRNGIGTLLEVLTLEEHVLTLERQARMLEYRERSLRVDLYEALGGGVPPVGAVS
jgi:NodT family efflux transporter outer membrane factor (OMF) lipoprotein